MRDSWRRLLVAGVMATLAAAGCGGGGGSDPIDAGPIDAEPIPDGKCPVPPGESYIMREFGVLAPEEGFDLNGDGVIENSLGNIPESVLSSANDGMAAAITSGEIIMLTVVTDWTVPPTATDDDVGFFLLAGYDGESPAYPVNNFTGDGNFYARVAQFDLNCQPETICDQASIQNRVMSAFAPDWEFPLTVGLGTFSLQDAAFTATFDETFTTMEMSVGAVLSLCSLMAVPFPGDIGGTILDGIVNDPSLSGEVLIDMDMDGDGLEQVIGDGVAILKCIDGDGVTEIQSRDCPCHPSIADGISAGLRASWITANIIGTK